MVAKIVIVNATLIIKAVSARKALQNDDRAVMLSIFARQINSENYSGGELSLFIYISTMDDRHIKDVQADTADEKAKEAEKIAGEAHESAADAHEAKAEGYKEGSAS